MASRSIACLRRNSSVLTLCHWKGVCGLGVKLLTVSVSRRRPLPRALVSRCSRRTVSAIPITSPSVSPGSPIMK